MLATKRGVIHEVVGERSFQKPQIRAASLFVPPDVSSTAYDGSNRLTSQSGVSLGYDANGSLTTRGITTYTWNGRNQLVASSAGSSSFSYDALRRRVGATVNGSTTTYLHDGANPAAVSGNVMLAGGGLDEVYGQFVGEGASSYLLDANNSTVAEANAGGTLTASHSYSPYGDTVATGCGTTGLQFTGRDNDGMTGLYYYRARYYSPKMMRFISEDPIGLRGGSNVFAYANGNPLSNRDPSGLDAWGGLTGGISSAEAQMLSAVQNATTLVAGCLSSAIHNLNPWSFIPDFVGVGALTGGLLGADFGWSAAGGEAAELGGIFAAGEATGDLVILGGVGLADTVASSVVTDVLLGSGVGTVVAVVAIGIYYAFIY
jgi:RHS repeat-associated protein